MAESQVMLYAKLQFLSTFLYVGYTG